MGEEIPGTGSFFSDGCGEFVVLKVFLVVGEVTGDFRSFLVLGEESLGSGIFFSYGCCGF